MMHISAVSVKPARSQILGGHVMATRTADSNDQEGTFRRPRLHGELLATSLLAILRDWNAHGYQLAKRLGDLGLPPFDSGTIYRTLRQLEQDVLGPVGLRPGAARRR